MHSRTFCMNRESVLLTIPSKFLAIFPFIAFLSSSISFLMLLRRSLLASLDRSVLLKPSFPWLPFGSCTSSSFLLFFILFGEQFSSCCNCCLISRFCLISSSTLAVRAWTCSARAVDSDCALDSIWTKTKVGQRIYP